MTTGFIPTYEQSAARDTFVAGHSFVLQAGAGTGKTSTLKLLAETAPDRKGLYVAFNRAIAQEAIAKFPVNVTVKTIHALAMHGTGFAFKDRPNKPTVPLYLAANRLGVFGDVKVSADRRLRPTTQAGLAMRTLRRVLCERGRHHHKRHVPHTPGLSDSQQRAIATGEVTGGSQDVTAPPGAAGGDSWSTRCAWTQVASRSTSPLHRVARRDPNCHRSGGSRELDPVMPPSAASRK